MMMDEIRTRVDGLSFRRVTDDNTWVSIQTCWESDRRHCYLNDGLGTKGKRGWSVGRLVLIDKTFELRRPFKCLA